MNKRPIIKVNAIVLGPKMKYILSFLFVCFIHQASGIAGMDAFLNDLVNGQDEGKVYLLKSRRQGMLNTIIYIFKQATMCTMLKNAHPLELLDHFELEMAFLLQWLT